MTETSRVGEKGQAVIPKAIRDAAGIVPGDVLAFHLDGRRIVVERAGTGAVVAQMQALVPRKTPEPDRIDWDAEYAARFRPQ